MCYECCCTDITLDKWEMLMKGARKVSYKKLIKLIKEFEPALYDHLALQFSNPFAENCRQTKTHYILVHSAIEFFFKK